MSGVLCGFSGIDRHIRCRQQDLNMDKKFRVKRWSTRVNISILSLCIVDSWLLFKSRYGTARTIGPWIYYCKLADSLIDNFKEGSGASGESCAIEHESARSCKRPLYGNCPQFTPAKRRRKKEGWYDDERGVPGALLHLQHEDSVRLLFMWPRWRWI